ncbi:MAG: 4-hydroxy-tetrahydrodipicolinate synthase [Flavipsychrobacter sp.]|nr:4-hydroxy-tetrahydrodipicolinate synthase [Flavipsychrobacter sp.]
MSHKFSGTGVALVTPFNNDNTIDFASLGKLVNHVIANKVNYLVALGTTAETPTLSADEKKKILAFIIAQNAGRVPVVCGIGGNNTAEIVHQLKNDDLQGVDGILSVAPYYSKPTQEGMYQHFKAIAEATDKPIILYNVPGRTASNLAPATALRLANEYGNIVAIKEASGSLPQCMELVKGKPEHFAVLSGDDDLIVSQIAIGIEGVISVAANCYTADFTQMVGSALENDYAAARKLLYKLLPGIGLLFAEGNPAGVKAALKLLNIGQNKLRLPLVPVSEETFAKISDFNNNL